VVNLAVNFPEDLSSRVRPGVGLGVSRESSVAERITLHLDPRCKVPAPAPALGCTSSCARAELLVHNKQLVPYVLSISPSGLKM
jgi:hypothetical protein